MQHVISSLLNQYEAGRMSRREVVARLGVLFGAAAGAGQGLAAENAESNASTFEATELNHIALRVTDVKRSRDFYMKHLGLKVSRESDSSAFLTFGDNFLALFRGDQPGMDHYCYSVKGYEVAEAERKLRAAGLKNIERTSGRIYFDDPDGLQVQLAAPQHGP